MEYEFSHTENETIAKAATWGKLLGIVMFVQAGLTLISDFNVIGAGINVTIGIFYLLGGVALRKVVETEGRDVALLMHALHKLGNAFLTRILVMAIAMALLLSVGVIVALVFAVSY